MIPLPIQFFPRTNPINTQAFARTHDITVINDDELMAVNGGFFWGPAGGIMQGAAANRVGVQLDVGVGGIGSGTFIVRVITGQS